MARSKPIQVFEYEKLLVGNQGFSKVHLNALLGYNQQHNFQYFDGIINGIQFKQYVGIIQVNGLTIEILPKADKSDGSSHKDWQVNLIKMLRTCRRLKADPIGEAHVTRHRHHLLEVYFELYLKEIDSLIHKGLIKQYRKQSNNVKALKGKLEFAENVRQNHIHKERFFTSHQVYDTNHSVHQVLFKALEVVEFFTRGSYLANKTKRVILDFPQVSNIVINESTFTSLPKGRKTEPYKTALEIARMLLLNYSPDISQGREKMLALLFDMNVLWEEFVLQMLKKAFRDDPTVFIKGQDSKPFWGSNTLRPDIVLENKREGESQIAVIDTKWKRPTNKVASVGDLRQMYAYNKFWNSSKAMLLYPGEYNNTIFKPFRNELEAEHQCKMHYLDVKQLFEVEAYKELAEGMFLANELIPASKDI